MAKDISQYIDFGKGDAHAPSRSIRSLLNQPCTVLEWHERESRFRDGNPSGKYVQMLIDTAEGRFTVNTGSAIIMEELTVIKTAKDAAFEKDMSFTCMVKRCGNGIKLYPLEWERKDVRSQMGKEP